MRIRNKELRMRRHRKEQLIKEAKRVAIATKGTAPKPEKKVAEKPAAKPKAPAKAAAPKKPAKTEAAEKTKKAPAKKKVEEPEVTVAEAPVTTVQDTASPEIGDPVVAPILAEQPAPTETL